MTRPKPTAQFSDLHASGWFAALMGIGMYRGANGLFADSLPHLRTEFRLSQAGIRGGEDSYRRRLANVTSMTWCMHELASSSAASEQGFREALVEFLTTFRGWINAVPSEREHWQAVFAEQLAAEW